jgi:TetR/AcrR family tetracycline transcriptional repressor
MKIDRTEIVREAVALLNEVGIDKLSTRALAARLGVQQPALYWHFKGKRELMDAMNAEMMRSSHLYRLPNDGDDWRHFLVEYCLSFRKALIACRDGARVHAGSRAEASDREVAERQLQFLTAEGFSAAMALRILIVLSRFTVGFVLEEQAEKEHPPAMPAEDMDNYPLLAAAFRDYVGCSQDDLFLDGLKAIVQGIRLSGDANAEVVPLAILPTPPTG